MPLPLLQSMANSRGEKLKIWLPPIKVVGLVIVRSAPLAPTPSAINAMAISYLTALHANVNQDSIFPVVLAALSASTIVMYAVQVPIAMPAIKGPSIMEVAVPHAHQTAKSAQQPMIAPPAKMDIQRTMGRALATQKVFLARSLPTTKK